MMDTRKYLRNGRRLAATTFVLIGFVLLATGLFPQAIAQDTGNIGVLVTNKDYKPISEAEVLLDGEVVGETGSDGTLLISDVATGAHKVEAKKEGYEPAEKTVEIKEDVTSQVHLRLKELENPEVVAEQVDTLTGHDDWVRSVAFSPDGELLASASVDGTVRLWDVTTGRVIRTLSPHSGQVYSVAFSPEGQVLASGHANGVVSLWDVSTGENIDTFRVHSDTVLALWLAFHPIKDLLASSWKAWEKGKIGFWDVGTGKKVKTISGDGPVAFSPSGELLASGSMDNAVKLWDVTTGREVDSFPGHSEGLTSVTFSPNGKLLASGSVDKTIKLWEVASGKNSRTLGHNSVVSSVKFSPVDMLLAAGSDAGNIRIWNAISGEIVSTLAGYSSSVLSVAFSPNGELLASGSGAGKIKIWEINR